MEQKNTATAVQGAEVVKPNGKQLVRITVGKDIVLDELPELDPENFTSFIGSLVDPKSNLLSFKAKGMKISFCINDGSGKALEVVLPSETSGNDRLSRVISAFKTVTKQMFAGFLLEEITVNPVHVAILQSLNEKGIRFSTFSKVAVSKGLREWAENKRLKVAALVERERAKNIRMIAENEVIREDLKPLAEANRVKISELKPALKIAFAEAMDK